jgi:hypothetical protein
MKNINYNYSVKNFLAVLMLLVFAGCDRDNIEGLELASFPINGEVFIDGFSGGLQYAAFGDSDVTAFQIDTDITYDNSAASMVFAVPDFGDPAGPYAGGTFIAEGGRDLSSFNALTFWARGSRSATINVVGFGNDFGELKYVTSINDVAINTNWKKYIIPIPDPSKLKQEAGMFYYAEGPENGEGYTFWIDEVKYETLGTIAFVGGGIFNGEDRVVAAETGGTVTVEGYAEFSVPGGIQRIAAAPAYFTYTSSNPSVATVNDAGIVTILDEGEAVITAQLRGEDAAGSLIISGTGEAVIPEQAAPTPTIPQEDVISIFSNAYNNVPVDFFNGYWEFSTALDFDLQVDGDDIKRYTNLNFVGIQFTMPTIDVTEMTHFHMDLWTPDATAPPAAFKVLLFNVGPDLTFGTADDAGHEITLTSPTIKTGEWVSLDLPFSSFPGLTSRNFLAQIVLSGDLPNVFVDNIYFYDDGGMTGGGDTPTVAAPNPTVPAGDVISIFSDAYSNLESNLNPDWGQATVVSEVAIGGNNTLLYSGLNYQGLELASSADVSGMTHLHIDYWTSNSSTLNAYLISTGPVETPAALSVPTSGWASVDIPLSNFSPVDLADIIQLKFDGDGNIYLDNIYFYNDENVGGDTPTVAAPTPTYGAGNVISVFSDAYTNIGGNLNPDWGQATAVSEVDIAGNNTLLYTGLNYQGLEFDASQDVSGMTTLHLDFWTANSTTLNVYLISPGPAETPYSLAVPTSGWTSIDIPLTEFSSVVDLTDVIQFKFDGDGDIYIDNLLFHNE